MKTVVIASTNPVKVRVAERAFKKVFPKIKFEFIKVKSESGVPDQPMGEETVKGAHNRLKFIRKKYPKADYWISQEGGLWKEDKRLFNRAWIIISDKTGYIGESSTSNFYLPKEIVKHIKKGVELGVAHDKVFGTINSGQAGGTIGHLTDGLIDRTEYYVPAAIIALSEVKHKNWY